MKKQPKQILTDAEQLMRLVDEAFGHLSEGPEDRRVPGLRNFLVFGEAVLAQMRMLSKAAPLFAAWFDDHQQAYAKDSEAIELASLAKVVLREPTERRDFTIVQLASAGKEYGRRPDGARAFFSADRLGGSGWEITTPSGAVEKYYVALPQDSGPKGYRFEGDAKGQGQAIQPLARRHLKYLREVFRYAQAAIN